MQGLEAVATIANHFSNAEMIYLQSILKGLFTCLFSFFSFTNQLEFCVKTIYSPCCCTQDIFKQPNKAIKEHSAIIFQVVKLTVYILKLQYNFYVCISFVAVLIASISRCCVLRLNWIKCRQIHSFNHDIIWCLFCINVIENKRHVYVCNNNKE